MAVLVGCGLPPVQEEGRIVRLRTESHQRICGGTLEALDRHIELIFETIGEQGLGEVSIDYAVTDDGSLCRFTDRNACILDTGVDRITIISPRVPHLHELAHAAHMTILPRNRPFLQEGFAELFGEWRTQPLWDESDDLNGLFAYASSGEAHGSVYHPARVFTSRLVRAHGFGGLREFWHAVPPTPSVADVHASVLHPSWGVSPGAASAADVHDAYRQVFGGEATDLITPTHEYDEILGCVWVLCEDPVPWEGDIWRLDPPMSDCENDPDAVGPLHVNDTRIARFGTVEFEPGTYELIVESGEFAFATPCGHDCILGPSIPPYPIVPSFDPDEPVTITAPHTQRWKMQTVAWLDQPGYGLTIRRLNP
jgi:hypothetical protein